MPEYALKFDYGWWIVIQKYPNAEAIEIGRYEELEQAMRTIQAATGGAPVLLKVLHA